MNDICKASKTLALCLLGSLFTINPQLFDFYLLLKQAQNFEEQQIVMELSNSEWERLKSKD